MSEEHLDVGRRRFLATALPLGTIACLWCNGLAASSFMSVAKSKLSENSGMTTEETYVFFYDTFIPVLQSLAREMGRDLFITTLTKAAFENTGQMIAAMAKDLSKRDIKAFSAFLQNILGMPPYNQIFSYEVVERTGKVLELKYTACLPAKLLRAMNAADIGFALECSGSAATARAFNPKITTSNPKNMMKGDSFCIERFVLEA